MREYVITTGGATISGTTTLTFIRAGAAPTTNNEFLRHWINQSATATSSQTRVQLALNSGTVAATAFTPTIPVASPRTPTMPPTTGSMSSSATTPSRW